VKLKYGNDELVYIFVICCYNICCTLYMHARWIIDWCVV